MGVRESSMEEGTLDQAWEVLKGPQRQREGPGVAEV